MGSPHAESSVPYATFPHNDDDDDGCDDDGDFRSWESDVSLGIMRRCEWWMYNGRVKHTPSVFIYATYPSTHPFI